MHRIVAACLLLLGILVPSAAAQTNEDYDSTVGVPISATTVRTAAPLSAQLSFNTAAFGAEAEYSAPTAYAGCTDSPPQTVSWGSRTAWLRFTTAASGRLAVSVDSSAAPYDVFFLVYEMDGSVPPESASLAQRQSINCHSEILGGPNESYAFQNGDPIRANKTVYVQTLSVCARRPNPPQPCTLNERNGATGGPTTVQITFKPDNQDSDNVPDPIDQCATEPGAEDGKPFVGCPDGDGDGVTSKGSEGDQCPTVKGSGADGCRIADEDGDQHDSNKAPFKGDDCDDDHADVHPGLDEVPDNAADENCDGKLFVDKDDDNHDDLDPTADCQPPGDSIYVGAPVVLGNKVDEDCDGLLEPFPRLGSTIRARQLTRTGNPTWVGFAGFVVNDARKGMRVRIVCAGKRNCPYGGGKTFPVKADAAKLTVGKAFHFKRKNVVRVLAASTKVTVWLTQPGHVGRAVRYTLRKKGAARKERLCSEAGADKLQPEAKCTGVD